MSVLRLRPTRAYVCVERPKHCILWSLARIIPGNVNGKTAVPHCLHKHQDGHCLILNCLQSGKRHVASSVTSPFVPQVSGNTWPVRDRLQFTWLRTGSGFRTQTIVEKGYQWVELKNFISPICESFRPSL